jgi:Cd2+/Zn2+-exporting ATPase
MVSAITNGARKGVLFKGGVHVEQVAEVNTVAFDKTGTLTQGKPKVVEIIPLKGHSKDELLHIASSLECLSKHPLGDALVECADKNGVHNECVDDFKTIIGKGVKGRVNGSQYFVGDPTLFNEKALKPVRKYLIQYENEAKTVVLVGTKDKIFGLVTLADQLRSTGSDMVAGLRKVGVKRIVMLTGDNDKTAKRIADKLGINEYHSELLPEEKVKVIKNLAKSNSKNHHKGKIAMIGDGINDSPALAAADIGIAMGAAGSDTALETADVALMKDDLSKVPYMIKLGRKTMRVVKQNILLAVGIKLLFAILVFPGFVTLWMAVAIGDMGVSLGVILNALRLGRV